MRLRARKLALFCLVLLFAALNLGQMVSVVQVQAAQGVKLYHLVVVPVIPLVLNVAVHELLRVTGELILVGVAYAGWLSIGLLGYITSGLWNAHILKWLFAFALTVGGYSLARRVLRDGMELKLQRLFDRVAWFVLLLALSKVLVFWPLVREAIVRGERPELFWLYGGGPNLEATWLALNGAFVRRCFWVYWGMVSLLAGAYGSRVGMALAAVSGVTRFLHEARERSRAGVAGLAIAVGMAASATLAAGTAVGVVPLALERWRAAGADTASVTRLEMWRASVAALWEYPWGRGAGNAIYFAEEKAGADFVEDNVHNLFLQMALDFGIVGGGLWVVVVLLIARKVVEGELVGPWAYCAWYVLAALVQFKGGDAPFAFVLGMACAYVGSTRSARDQRA